MAHSHPNAASHQTKQQQLVAITEQVEEAVRHSGVSQGICSFFTPGATAGIMIQENWDQSVQNDVITLLSRPAPKGVWEHARQDGNYDAHLKSGLVGPSETIPILPAAEAQKPAAVSQSKPSPSPQTSQPAQSHHNKMGMEYFGDLEGDDFLRTYAESGSSGTSDPKKSANQTAAGKDQGTGKLGFSTWQNIFF